ncbi:MAG: prolyl oligopeptidase family serine peptidase [Bdellovibrionota bacterium]
MKSLFKPLALLSLTLSLSALGAPNPTVLEEIRAGYDAKISVKEMGIETHLFSAPVKKIQVLGMDPITRESRKVEVSEYFEGDAEKAKNAATIIILPPTGGTNALDTGYAELFASRGFRALLIEHWGHDDDTVNMELVSHDRSALRALVAVKHVVEYASKSSRGKIGILGTSVGGLTASLALGEESRISVGALIVAGGVMPEIIAHSTEENVSKLRTARFAKNGYHDEMEYEAALKAVLRYENLEFANFTGHKAVWMAMGLSDTTVPTKNQFDLLNALEPKTADLVKFNANHVNSIIGTYMFQRWTIADFFARELN